jgi:hypothetical protein
VVMVMVMVMVMVVIVMMVIVMMVMVMMVVVMMMVIFGNYHRLFFRDGGVGGAFILDSQNVLCIRDGIQQLGE